MQLTKVWPLSTAAVFCLLLIVSTTDGAIKKTRKRVVCYYTNWSVYRLGLAKFLPANINPHLCTHLIYAFGGFDDDFQLMPFDKYQDIQKGGYARFNGLKQYNRGLRTLLAVGGWNEGSGRFSELVADPEYRRTFAVSAVRYLRQYNFDGLDLDWEYPGSRAGSDYSDKDNYATFCEELRQAFEAEAVQNNRPSLLLTVAIPAGVATIDKGFDVPRLNSVVDFFNILAYDYHASTEALTDHHAALLSLPGSSEFDSRSELNVDYTVRLYLKLGAERRKLVVGIPTYGRSYTLVDENYHGLQAASESPGTKGKNTKEHGYLSFYEICENVAVDHWAVYRPYPEQMGPYATLGKQWVAYDDEFIVKKSVRVQAEYARDNHLGGIMFWSIDNDDFRGRCTGRPYPLIEAAKEAYLAPAPGDPPKQKRGPTPAPPVTPDPGADFSCKREGFFPHPEECDKYFWCLSAGQLGMVPHSFTCPSGLLFNRQTDSCDFPRNVKCKVVIKEVKSITFPPTREPTTLTSRPIDAGQVTPDPFDEYYEDYDTADLPPLDLLLPGTITVTTVRPASASQTTPIPRQLLGGSGGGDSGASAPVWTADTAPVQSDSEQLGQVLATIRAFGGVEGVRALLEDRADGFGQTASALSDKHRQTLIKLLSRQEATRPAPGYVSISRPRPSEASSAASEAASEEAAAVGSEQLLGDSRPSRPAPSFSRGRRPGPTDPRSPATGDRPRVNTDVTTLSKTRRRPQYTSIQRNRLAPTAAADDAVTSPAPTDVAATSSRGHRRQYVTLSRQRPTPAGVVSGARDINHRAYVTLQRPPPTESTLRQQEQPAAEPTSPVLPFEVQASLATHQGTSASTNTAADSAGDALTGDATFESLLNLTDEDTNSVDPDPNGGRRIRIRLHRPGGRRGQETGSVPTGPSSGPSEERATEPTKDEQVTTDATSNDAKLVEVATAAPLYEATDGRRIRVIRLKRPRDRSAPTPTASSPTAPAELTQNEVTVNNLEELAPTLSAVPVTVRDDSLEAPPDDDLDEVTVAPEDDSHEVTVTPKDTVDVFERVLGDGRTGISNNDLRQAGRQTVVVQEDTSQPERPDFRLHNNLKRLDSQGEEAPQAEQVVAPSGATRAGGLLLNRLRSGLRRRRPAKRRLSHALQKATPQSGSDTLSDDTTSAGEQTSTEVPSLGLRRVVLPGRRRLGALPTRLRDALQQRPASESLSIGSVVDVPAEVGRTTIVDSLPESATEEVTETTEATLQLVTEDQTKAASTEEVEHNTEDIGSDSTTAVPETRTKLAETTSERLESTTELPETTTELHETTTELPETTTELPETTTELPETTTELPETTTELIDETTATTVLVDEVETHTEPSSASDASNLLGDQNVLEVPITGDDARGTAGRYKAVDDAIDTGTSSRRGLFSRLRLAQSGSTSEGSEPQVPRRGLFRRLRPSLHSNVLTARQSRPGRGPPSHGGLFARRPGVVSVVPERVGHPLVATLSTVSRPGQSHAAETTAATAETTNSSTVLTSTDISTAATDTKPVGTTESADSADSADIDGHLGITISDVEEITTVPSSAKYLVAEEGTTEPGIGTTELIPTVHDTYTEETTESNESSVFTEDPPDSISTNNDVTTSDDLPKPTGIPFGIAEDSTITEETSIGITTQTTAVDSLLHRILAEDEDKGVEGDEIATTARSTSLDQAFHSVPITKEDDHDANEDDLAPKRRIPVNSGLFSLRRPGAQRGTTAESGLFSLRRPGAQRGTTAETNIASEQQQQSLTEDRPSALENRPSLRESLRSRFRTGVVPTQTDEETDRVAIRDRLAGLRGSLLHRRQDQRGENPRQAAGEGQSVSSRRESLFRRIPPAADGAAIRQKIVRNDETNEGKQKPKPAHVHEGLLQRNSPLADREGEKDLHNNEPSVDDLFRSIFADRRTGVGAFAEYAFQEDAASEDDTTTDSTIPEIAARSDDGTTYNSGEETTDDSANSTGQEVTELPIVAVSAWITGEEASATENPAPEVPLETETISSVLVSGVRNLPDRTSGGSDDTRVPDSKSDDQQPAEDPLDRLTRLRNTLRQSQLSGSASTTTELPEKQTEESEEEVKDTEEQKKRPLLRLRQGVAGTRHGRPDPLTSGRRRPSPLTLGRRPPVRRIIAEDNQDETHFTTEATATPAVTPASSSPVKTPLPDEKTGDKRALPTEEDSTSSAERDTRQRPSLPRLLPIRQNRLSLRNRLSANNAASHDATDKVDGSYAEVEENAGVTTPKPGIQNRHPPSQLFPQRGAVEAEIQDDADKDTAAQIPERPILRGDLGSRLRHRFDRKPSSIVRPGAIEEDPADLFDSNPEGSIQFSTTPRSRRPPALLLPSQKRESIPSIPIEPSANGAETTAILLQPSRRPSLLLGSNLGTLLRDRLAAAANGHEKAPIGGLLSRQATSAENARGESDANEAITKPRPLNRHATLFPHNHDPRHEESAEEALTTEDSETTQQPPDVSQVFKRPVLRGSLGDRLRSRLQTGATINGRPLPSASLRAALDRRQQSERRQQISTPDANAGSLIPSKQIVFNFDNREDQTKPFDNASPSLSQPLESEKSIDTFPPRLQQSNAKPEARSSLREILRQRIAGRRQSSLAHQVEQNIEKQVEIITTEVPPLPSRQPPTLLFGSQSTTETVEKDDKISALFANLQEQSRTRQATVFSVPSDGKKSTESNEDEDVSITSQPPSPLLENRVIAGALSNEERIAALLAKLRGKTDSPSKIGLLDSTTQDHVEESDDQFGTPAIAEIDASNETPTTESETLITKEETSITDAETPTTEAEISTTEAGTLTAEIEATTTTPTSPSQTSVRTRPTARLSLVEQLRQRQQQKQTSVKNLVELLRLSLHGGGERQDADDDVNHAAGTTTSLENSARATTEAVVSTAEGNRQSTTESTTGVSESTTQANTEGANEESQEQPVGFFDIEDVEGSEEFAGPADTEPTSSLVFTVPTTNPPTAVLFLETTNPAFSFEGVHSVSTTTSAKFPVGTTKSTTVTFPVAQTPQPPSTTEATVDEGIVFAVDFTSDTDAGSTLIRGQASPIQSTAFPMQPDMKSATLKDFARIDAFLEEGIVYALATNSETAVSITPASTKGSDLSNISTTSATVPSQLEEDAITDWAGRTPPPSAADEETTTPAAGKQETTTPAADKQETTTPAEYGITVTDDMPDDHQTGTEASVVTQTTAIEDAVTTVITLAADTTGTTVTANPTEATTINDIIATSNPFENTEPTNTTEVADSVTTTDATDTTVSADTTRFTYPTDPVETPSTEEVTPTPAGPTKTPSWHRDPRLFAFHPAKETASRPVVTSAGAGSAGDSSAPGQSSPGSFVSVKVSVSSAHDTEDDNDATTQTVAASVPQTEPTTGPSSASVVDSVFTVWSADVEPTTLAPRAGQRDGHRVPTEAPPATDHEMSRDAASHPQMDDLQEVTLTNPDQQHAPTVGATEQAGVTDSVQRERDASNEDVVIVHAQSFENVAAADRQADHAGHVLDRPHEASLVHLLPATSGGSERTLFDRDNVLAYSTVTPRYRDPDSLFKRPTYLHRSGGGHHGPLTWLLGITSLLLLGSRW